MMTTMRKVLLFAVAMCCVIAVSAQQFKIGHKAQKTLEETLQMVEKMNRHDRAYTMELDSVTSEYTKIALDYDAHSNCT